MGLLRKALLLSAIGAVGLYAFARATIPPTVFVFVAVEDVGGGPLPLQAGWNQWNFMDDGVLRPHGTVMATDDLDPPKRRPEMKRWGCRLIDGTEYAIFACRPGARAAFAAMWHEDGAAESVIELPQVSTLFPWTMRSVCLRLPQRRDEPLGQLEVTVLEPDGSIADTHPGLRLASPVGKLPLLMNFSRAFGVNDRRAQGPVSHRLPAGRYRVSVGQWVGISCGNTPPSIDRHQRKDVVVNVKAGRLSQVTLECPLGTRLDLDLTLSGDGGEFARARESFLEGWEAEVSARNGMSSHRWRAEAWLQRLDPLGAAMKPAECYACGWDGCRYMMDRYQFPVSGLIRGLRQYSPGRYRLTIEGKGIETLTEEFELPDLDGGSLVLCSSLTAAPAAHR